LSPRRPAQIARCGRRRPPASPRQNAARPTRQIWARLPEQSVVMRSFGHARGVRGSLTRRRGSRAPSRRTPPHNIPALTVASLNALEAHRTRPAELEGNPFDGSPFEGPAAVTSSREPGGCNPCRGTPLEPPVGSPGQQGVEPVDGVLVVVSTVDELDSRHGPASWRLNDIRVITASVLEWRSGRPRRCRSGWSLGAGIGAGPHSGYFRPPCRMCAWNLRLAPLQFHFGGWLRLESSQEDVLACRTGQTALLDWPRRTHHCPWLADVWAPAVRCLRCRTVTFYYDDRV
jgi:hypothetical protein